MIRRTLSSVCLIVFWSCLFAFAGEGADVRYVSGVEDLPLMPGLTEVGDFSVTFDTPAGRLVEVEAMGVLGEGAVEAFYADTLPALGWIGVGPGAFVREGEYLHIEFNRAGELLTVRFSISPRAP